MSFSSNASASQNWKKGFFAYSIFIEIQYIVLSLNPFFSVRLNLLCKVEIFLKFANLCNYIEAILKLYSIGQFGYGCKFPLLLVQYNSLQENLTLSTVQRS